MSIPLQLANNAFGDRYLEAFQQSQFSRQSAAGVLQQHFENLLFEDKTLYLIIGTDSEHLCRYLNNSQLPEKSRYLFIELEEVVDTLGIEATYGAQIRVQTFDKWEQSLNELNFPSYTFLNRVHIIKSLAAQADYANCYFNGAWEVEKRLTQLRWQQVATLGIKPLLKSQLLNAPDLLIPSGVLEGRYRHQTALILAGGPSLNTQFDWIRRNRSGVVILAVSRIAGILSREGITPDFFVHVDPKISAFNVSKDALDLSDKVPLIASHHAQPLMLAQWRSQVYFSGARLPWESELNEPTLNKEGPTVTNTALTSAIGMGFSRILFAGLDLCFDKQGYSHAQGSNEASCGPSFRPDTCPVLTNDGNEADTSPDYFAAIESLTRQAQVALSHNIELVNLSGSAARIEGIVYRQSDELEFPENSSAPVVPPMPDPSERQHYLARLDDELASCIQQLSFSAKAAVKAKELSQRLLTPKGTIDSKIQLQLDKLERDIEALPASMMNFCKVFGLGMFIGEASHKESDDWTAQDILDFGNGYFGALAASFKEVIELIEYVRHKTALRQMELQPSPELDKLIEGWSEEKVFLRAKSWLKEFGKRSPAQATEQLIEQMHQRFEEMRKAAQETDLKRCHKNSSPSKLLEKANRLFSHRRMSELHGLLAFLEKREGKEFHSGHSALLRGYIAELEGNNQKALNEHQHIIEEQYIDVLEPSLQRVLAISATEKNRPQMFQAIECLSLLSPQYLKHYGRLQKADGDIPGAIESMTRHYEFFPSDMDNLTALAELYMDISEPNAARTVVDEVLRQQPNNRAAKRIISTLEHKNV